MKIAVVQSVIERSLAQNCEKLIHFIKRAKAEECELAIFPESSLYWSDIAVDEPTYADIEAAISQVADTANSEHIAVIFGSQHKAANAERYHTLGLVVGPDGKRLVSYTKNMEVPPSFEVCGVWFNLSVCSDRGYLEHSDLPCLVQGAQVIVDTSGGHGGDDGRPGLRWIRYRPWALRTNAFVIVSNPPHADTDFMGHSPWGGGSAIIRPDGSIQASLTHEQDVMLVEEIDLRLATRAEAERRRNHPIFKPFWDMGAALIEGKTVSPVPEITPYGSDAQEITIAAAQIACSREIAENVKKIQVHIQQAARQGADVVVFPSLAVTGAREDDIAQVRQDILDAALSQIRDAAQASAIDVIVGMPAFVNGALRNSGFVIGSTGQIKTRYDQFTATGRGAFEPGRSLRPMWFQLKGVHSILTLGEDARWVEIGDLAANRGMQLHFHLDYAADSSSADALLRQQQNLLMLSYAQYGVVVNAADPSDLPNPSSASSGMSMIVSREGGHNRPAPKDLAHYLPYQTSIVESAGATETMIVAVRKTSDRNAFDLTKYWRNKNRRSRAQKGWHDWMKLGAQIIDSLTH